MAPFFICASCLPHKRAHATLAKDILPILYRKLSMKNYFIFCALMVLSNTQIFSMLPPKEAPRTDGKTALMVAALRHLRMENLIKTDQTIINKQDDAGNTVLHYASMECDSLTIKLLMDNGADRSIKNNQGKTAQECFKENQKVFSRP